MKALPRDTRIAIIGAGVAGLSTAYFLKRRGFKDVTIFERLGRVGGLCKSITDGYRSFDLGGNYITKAYRETRKLAREVGATTYSAKNYVVGYPLDDLKSPVRYKSVSDWVREDPKDKRKKIPNWKLAYMFLRFALLRRRLSAAVDRPHFGNIHLTHPELCVSFADWLEQNGLGDMKRMFEIPMTMMGYGYLNELAAPYALKYMEWRTFRTMWRGIPLVEKLRSLPVIGGQLVRWPRRFHLGFQRLWERVSWGLDVRLDVGIVRVTRTNDKRLPIKIDLTYPDRIFNDHERVQATLYFDKLIIACPLTRTVLDAFLDISPAEKKLFGRVETYSFCQTTCHCDDLDLPAPVVCMVPFSRDTIGRPWVAVRIWEDDSKLVQFYTRVDLGNSSKLLRSGVDRDDNDRPIKYKVNLDEFDANDPVKWMVGREVERTIERMGGTICGRKDPKEERWYTYHQWPYFGHVSPKEIGAGFFWDLEQLQGERNTYYVGGATNFELVEPIVQYSKALVKDLATDDGFPRVTREMGPPAVSLDKGERAEEAVDVDKIVEIGDEGKHEPEQ